MPDPSLLATALAATVVGFSASGHCFLMCGPLACAAVPGQPTRLGPVLGYQGGRLLAYGLLGGLLGVVGAGASHLLQRSLAPVTPWILALTLLAAALDLGPRVPRIRGLAQILRSLARLAQKFSPRTRAFLIGASTALIPCGLLYGVFAASITAASFRGGALALGAFGLGAIPALLLAQLSAGRLLRSEGRLAQVARRAIPALAALVIAARAMLVHLGPACH